MRLDFGLLTYEVQSFDWKSTSVTSMYLTTIIIRIDFKP